MIRLVLVCLLFMSTAQAQILSGSTVDMTTLLKDRHGQSLRDVSASDETGKSCAFIQDTAPNVDWCPKLTLGLAVSTVLYMSFKEDVALDPKQRAARARLADELVENKTAHLTAKQVALIETLLGRQYGGLVLSQTYALLDPNLKLPEVE